jgi:hypothetical protein
VSQVKPFLQHWTPKSVPTDRLKRFWRQIPPSKKVDSEKKFVCFWGLSGWPDVVARNEVGALSVCEAFDTFFVSGEKNVTVCSNLRFLFLVIRVSTDFFGAYDRWGRDVVFRYT